MEIILVWCNLWNNPMAHNVALALPSDIRVRSALGFPPMVGVGIHN
jgi:hypothetical protein